MQNITFFSILSLIILFSSCNDIETNEAYSDQKNNYQIKSDSILHSYYLNQNDSCIGLEFVSHDFKIYELTGLDLPYYSGAKKINQGYLLDDNYVPYRVFQGKKTYHPVYVAQYSLHALDVYYSTKNDSILDQLKSIADKLICLSLNIDSTSFTPYSFSFALHGIKEQNLLSPWYSGMSQGQILSFFSRLYKVTKQEKYLEAGQRVFNSFLVLKGQEKTPWISCIDKNSNLWLEEYPMETPCFTLNGMIFAIYGVYDYYLVTSDEKALQILKASLTTIKNNIAKYRNENDYSYYCLKHKIKNEGYHYIHIGQLKMLYKITEDPFFLEMSKKFESDGIYKKRIKNNN